MLAGPACSLTVLSIGLAARRITIATPDHLRPIQCIHGRDDRTIPIAHGRRLFDRAPDPKEFLEVAGGHDDVHEIGRIEYDAGIRRFLKRLR